MSNSSIYIDSTSGDSIQSNKIFSLYYEKLDSVGYSIQTSSHKISKSENQKNDDGRNYQLANVYIQLPNIYYDLSNFDKVEGEYAIHGYYNNTNKWLFTEKTIGSATKERIIIFRSNKIENGIYECSSY